MTEPWIPKTQKGVFGNLLLWLAAGIILAGLVGGAFFVVDWVTAPAKGKLAARQQINSGAFRIAAYEQFFDACASVQGLEGQLDAQYDELATATGDDLERVRANIAGIRGERAQAVAEYNADARKGYTVGQFRSSDLPYELPANYEKGDDHTSCG